MLSEYRQSRRRAARLHPRLSIAVDENAWLQESPQRAPREGRERVLAVEGVAAHREHVRTQRRGCRGLLPQGPDALRRWIHWLPAPRKSSRADQRDATARWGELPMASSSAGADSTEKPNCALRPSCAPLQSRPTAW